MQRSAALQAAVMSLIIFRNATIDSIARDISVALNADAADSLGTVIPASLQIRGKVQVFPLSSAMPVTGCRTLDLHCPSDAEAVSTECS